MAKIKLNNVRISYPSLFRKGVFQGQETKYEATFLIDKKENKAKIDEIKAGLKDGSFAIWKGPIVDNTGKVQIKKDEVGEKTEAAPATENAEKPEATEKANE